MLARRIAVAVALATTALGVPAVPAAVAQDTPNEAKVRDLIDAARRPCKLKPPLSSGVSEFDAGYGGVKEVSATFVRKDPFGSSDDIVVARWEIRAGKPKPQPLDPLAGEVNRRCRDDAVKPDSAYDWRSLPYFGGYDQANLYLITNDRWNRADQLTKHLPNQTGAQDWGEIGGFIWRGECDPGKDSVRLSRTIFLPGRPWDGADIRAGVTMADGVLSPAARSITEVDVLLNGERILKVRKSGFSSDFDEVPARVFRHGANKIVIEAKKRKTGKCNKGRASRLVGVEFWMYASYVSDLAVQVPEHASAPGLQGIPVPFTLVNKGPSDIPEARLAFTFTIHTSGGKVLLQHSGAGECEPAPPYLLQPPTFGNTFVCRVRNIERRESKTFDWGVIPGWPEGENYWSGSLGWTSGISGMRETDVSNQNSGRTIQACRNGDTRCGPPTQGRPAAALVSTRLLP
jgi:hypothetical protein